MELVLLMVKKLALELVMVTVLLLVVGLVGV
jgi:hypothetical protein